jgi:hypothetical protein
VLPCSVFVFGLDSRPRLLFTQVNFADMAAQMSRMSQLAIDVENLKMRNALLESELLRTRQVQTWLQDSPTRPVGPNALMWHPYLRSGCDTHALPTWEGLCGLASPLHLGRALGSCSQCTSVHMSETK